MLSLAPPPRLLHCCRKKPITPPQPYKLSFVRIASFANGRFVALGPMRTLGQFRSVAVTFEFRPESVITHLFKPR